VEETAKSYAALDPNGLHAQSSMTQEDHFFSDAMPAMARFCPDVALEVVRRLAQSAPSRIGRSAFLCVSSLERHSAAFNPDNVEALLQVARDHALPKDPGQSNEDYATSQYA